MTLLSRITPERLDKQYGISRIKYEQVGHIQDTGLICYTISLAFHLIYFFLSKHCCDVAVSYFTNTDKEPESGSSLVYALHVGRDWASASHH